MAARARTVEAQGLISRRRGAIGHRPARSAGGVPSIPVLAILADIRLYHPLRAGAAGEWIKPQYGRKCKGVGMWWPERVASISGPTLGTRSLSPSPLSSSWPGSAIARDRITGTHFTSSVGLEPRTHCRMGPRDERTAIAARSPEDDNHF